ncbi:hypothetical protein [Pseudoalteromonas gelatinilytica]|uniref:Uncharacterized protein n=1 Tax=Pseudoalteromonas gelatinilytica TaxID=1703256 RepID=A0ABQ1TFX2_9GAMM|nr:hypothetical protein [Pseudoalteromonas profundi]GGE93855.1 hypothetical protein GCM10008027_18400 [Pseudoalteromonas profundi]
MDIFQYWLNLGSDSYKHPDDLVVLEELKEHTKKELNFEFPPGPYWGPLKKAKIVLCYANPSVNSPSLETIKDESNINTLIEQLKGTEKYPYKLNGWYKWFSQKANSLFSEINDAQRLEKASAHIAVINLIPYASENMKNLESIANCLPSAWAAQRYLRENLIPKAQRWEILLIMCRSSHLWGLKSPHGSPNILINNARNGFTGSVKKAAKKWITFQKIT